MAIRKSKYKYPIIVTDPLPKSQLRFIEDFYKEKGIKYAFLRKPSNKENTNNYIICRELLPQDDDMFFENTVETCEKEIKEILKTEDFIEPD